MNTVLIVFLMSLAQPSLPPRIVHKAFPTMEACQTAVADTIRNVPVPEGIKMSQFCVDAASLTGTEEF